MLKILQTQLKPEPKEMFLTYQQDKFIFAKDEFVCLKGTWRSGKSLAALWAVDKECEENPCNLYLVARKEWPDLRDSTLHDWNKFVGRPIDGTRNVHYPNGSVLMFRHGDDLNSFKNVTLGGALMIQAEEMIEEDFWFLKGRLSRKEGTNRLRLECNYDGHNWIYRLFNKEKIGTLITTNTFDNEANLPPDYIPGLMKLPKKLQERHLYGSDADMEGIVWEEFSYAKNVLAPFHIPSSWKKVVILDHGFTNPTAVIWIALDWDGNAYIYDEHYEAGEPISYHAQQVKLRDNSNVKKWLIDPSCAARTQQKKYANGKIKIHSILDEYKEEGIKFEPADHTQLTGINRANEDFKDSKLFIFKSCVNTIDEVSNWKWKTLKPGVQKNSPDEPVDYRNHTCDCIIYFENSRIQATEFPKEEINPNSAWANYLKTRKKPEEFVYG